MELNKKNNKMIRRKTHQVWVGVLNYKNPCDLTCEFFAIPYNLLTNIRLETSNKLIGLEEQKHSY